MPASQVPAKLQGLKANDLVFAFATTQYAGLTCRETPHYQLQTTDSPKVATATGVRGLTSPHTLANSLNTETPGEFYIKARKLPSSFEDQTRTGDFCFDSRKVSGAAWWYNDQMDAYIMDVALDGGGTHKLAVKTGEAQKLFSYLELQGPEHFSGEYSHRYAYRIPDMQKAGFYVATEQLHGAMCMPGSYQNEQPPAVSFKFAANQHLGISFDERQCAEFRSFVESLPAATRLQKSHCDSGGTLHLIRK